MTKERKKERNKKTSTLKRMYSLDLAHCPLNEMAGSSTAVNSHIGKVTPKTTTDDAKSTGVT